jgi:hypothetical protein
VPTQGWYRVATTQKPPRFGGLPHWTAE